MMLASPSLDRGEEIRDNISNDLAGGGAHFAAGLEEPPPFPSLPPSEVP